MLRVTFVSVYPLERFWVSACSFLALFHRNYIIDVCTMNPSELLISSLTREFWVKNTSINVIAVERILLSSRNLLWYWACELAKISIKNSICNELSPQRFKHSRDQPRWVCRCRCSAPIYQMHVAVPSFAKNIANSTASSGQLVTHPVSFRT